MGRKDVSVHTSKYGCYKYMYVCNSTASSDGGHKVMYHNSLQTHTHTHTQTHTHACHTHTFTPTQTHTLCPQATSQWQQGSGEVAQFRLPYVVSHGRQHPTARKVQWLTEEDTRTCRRAEGEIMILPYCHGAAHIYLSTSSCRGAVVSTVL